MKFLIKQGADPHDIGSTNRSLMMHAAQGGQLEVIQYLQSLGVPLTNKKNSSEQVLANAISSGNVDLVKYHHKLASLLSCEKVSKNIKP